MAKTIKFTIKQDGTVTEEVTGVVGNDCQQLTKVIEDKLGKVSQVLYKPEYYQTVKDVSLQHNTNTN
tara:strand:+ start:758 stop:958 length:201 start_codon:yes stop_codon:yes gene_type:complete